MRRKQTARLLPLIALAVTIGGVMISSPASGAPVISDQNASRAVKALIGSELIRAEIVTFNAGEVGDLTIDRGVVRTARGRVLTLVERDGKVVSVRLSPTTQIRIDDRYGAARGVRPGMRATVMKEGNAAASWLYAVRRSPDRSGLEIKALLSTGFVRAELISWAGAVLDRRVDTGVIQSANGSSLTLQENDGATVQMQVGGATQVRVDNTASSAADLTTGMRAVTISNGDGVASQIWAQTRRLSGGRK